MVDTVDLEAEIDFYFDNNVFNTNKTTRLHFFEEKLTCNVYLQVNIKIIVVRMF